MPDVSGGTLLLNPQEILTKAGVVPGVNVADFGCGGAGHFVFPAARIVGNDNTVYAVDVLKSVLAGIESKAKVDLLNNIKTVWTDLEMFGATKIDADSLDVGLLINVLFQSKKQDAMIKESVRMVKPGGTLAVVDWKTAGAAFGPPTDERISSERVKEIAQSLNLTLQEEFEAGPYHYGLLFKK